MHDLKTILANLADVQSKTDARKTSFDFSQLEELAEARRAAIHSYESLRAEQKSSGGAMSKLKPGSDEFTALRTRLKTMSDELKVHEEARRQAEAAIEELLLHLPNIIGPETPIGESEDDNPVIREWGTLPVIENPRDHVDIGEALGMLDFEAAAKVTGARFVFIRSQLARLNRALIQFMLDLHTEQHGYEEIAPPFMVNRDSMIGTGQLPKFEDDAYETGGMFLVPTAEVPLTNMLRETLMDSMPSTIKICAYTPCFRQEAGSYGRDTRGMIRQHQFDKIEMVKFTHPDNSEAEHLSLVTDAESVLKALGLPFRTVQLCSADIGFAASVCYDIEVWLPSQNKYREISSCSNFRDFQARRAGIRFRDEDGKATFAHTINGSGLAVGRTLVAILENFQNPDGSVTVPEVLRPYTKFDRIG